MGRTLPTLPVELPAEGGPSIRPLGAADDLRPHLPEPPPVRLVAVSDVTLPMRAGLEHRIVPFYVDLLGFRRRQDHDELAFESDTFDLRFRVTELSPTRDDVRPIGVLSPRFNDIVEELDAMRYPYEAVRGLVAGHDGLLMQDPAGNWVALSPLREIR